MLLLVGVLLGGRRKLLPLPEPVDDGEARDTKFSPRPKLVGRRKEVGAAAAAVAAIDDVVVGVAAAVVLAEWRGRGGKAGGASLEAESVAGSDERSVGLVWDEEVGEGRVDEEEEAEDEEEEEDDNDDDEVDVDERELLRERASSACGTLSSTQRPPSWPAVDGMRSDCCCSDCPSSSRSAPEEWGTNIAAKEAAAVLADASRGEWTTTSSSI
jgi:hypothetical protein